MNSIERKWQVHRAWLRYSFPEMTAEEIEGHRFSFFPGWAEGRQSAITEFAAKAA